MAAPRDTDSKTADAAQRRAERLKSALRANIARRKEQARARGEGRGGKPAPEPAKAPPREE